MADDLTTTLISVVGNLPGVVVAKRAKSASFVFKGKVFAFTRPKGAVLKLPPDNIEKLVRNRGASMLVMGKRAMKEWVVIPYENPSDCSKDIQLFKKAMTFASRA